MYRFITEKNVLYIKSHSPTKYDISCSLNDWETVWAPYFDLNRNYSLIQPKENADSFMLKTFEEAKGIRILRQEPWEILISFIISQRKNIPSIKKAVETLANLYGEIIHTQYEDIAAFPTPSALCNASDSALKDCGLGYRVPYIKDAAAKINHNQALLTDWNFLDNPSLLTALKTIYGVGDKIANCVMLFAYGRTESVPIDTWIKKIITEKYNGQNPFPSYGIYAGIVQQYAFYYMQQHKSILQEN